MQCGLLSVMHRSDAYSSTSYSRGIRWLPSPEVCRMSSLVCYEYFQEHAPKIALFSTASTLIEKLNFILVTA